MFRSLAAGLMAAAALTALGASSAQAALIRTGACDTSSLSQPFRTWGDSNSYKLVPGGDFEDPLSGWSLHGATVLVQAVYALPLLGDVPVPVGVVTLSPGWSPTLPMLTASTVTGLLSNGTAQVGLRFTQLLGTSRIDDVYIDPRMR
jgi:hypothetical protein